MLGIDPGLAHCGWAMLDAELARLRKVGVIETQKADQTGDMQRRMDELTRALCPLVGFSDLVVVEWPSAGGFGRPDSSGARGNSKSAAQVNAVAGAVLGLCVALQKPCLYPSPVTWRSSLGASKGRDSGIHEQLKNSYPATTGPLRKAQLPHCLDAIGLALYGRIYKEIVER